VTTSASYYGEFDSDSQPTLNTVANYVTEARVLLQDGVTPFRYDNASLLVALNLTLLEARRVRPDLFVYNHKYNGQAQAFTAVDDTYVDIEPQFRLGIIYGTVAHAYARDQEDYSAEQASTFFSMFDAVLLGVKLPRMAPPAGPGRP